MNNKNKCDCGNLKSAVSKTCQKCYFKRWKNPQLGIPFSKKRKQQISLANTKYEKILTKSLLFELYIIQKLSTIKIGKKLNINFTTIKQYLQKHKIPIRKRSDYISPFIGKHHTKKSKRLLSLAHKGKNTYLKMSEKTKQKLANHRREIFSGKNNPNYVHGNSKFPYPLEFSDALKVEIRIRDAFKCQCCGVKEIEQFNRNLDIHHIDYNKFNNKKSNLITLCNPCNNNANYNRDYWYAYYTYLMENR